jgi:hypothetical protein
MASVAPTEPIPRHGCLREDAHAAWSDQQTDDDEHDPGHDLPRSPDTTPAITRITATIQSSVAIGTLLVVSKTQAPQGWLVYTPRGTSARRQ